MKIFCTVVENRQKTNDVYMTDKTNCATLINKKMHIKKRKKNLQTLPVIIFDMLVLDIVKPNSILGYQRSNVMQGPIICKPFQAALY